MAQQTVRVRYAPSPTGMLHVGGARTALYNWLFARHHGGRFILRIEDTDRTRYRADALRDLLQGLRWLGLDWDEGPEVGGAHGPYVQSERLPLYQEYAERLLAKGAAYRCYCTPERLTALRDEQAARGLPPGYDRACRDLSRQQIAHYEASGAASVVRLRTPLEGQTTIHDLIRGDITVENRTLDDLVLLKSDGYPTYHLANIVDDHLMEISHVLRGDEWIPSTPRHVLLYQAFGWDPPEFAHLPLILSPTGKGKLSKRKEKGPGGEDYLVMVHEFAEAGYLPEALFNFLALMGWSLDDTTEILTRQQAIAAFTVQRINDSPAVFSYDKLKWMNGVYIRQLAPVDLATLLTPILARHGMEVTAEQALKVALLVQERITTLNEAPGLVDFAFADDLSYDPELLIQKNMTADDARRALAAAHHDLAEAPAFAAEHLEARLRALAEAMGLKPGQLFGTVRVAITGRTVAPPLFGTMELLGREQVLKRLRHAQALLTTAGA
ncbi:MAG: glutamate--tRNA ligase [Anaerolineae bacterium]